MKCPTTPQPTEHMLKLNFETRSEISREWAQKALEEEEKKKEEMKKQKIQNGAGSNGHGTVERNETDTAAARKPSHPSVEPRLKKNFASLDCGAKVVAANAESNGAHNIISPSR